MDVTTRLATTASAQEILPAAGGYAHANGGCAAFYASPFAFHAPHFSLPFYVPSCCRPRVYLASSRSAIRI